MMPSYELTPAAELDLLEIARYTLENWGLEQANRYQIALEQQFAAMARDEAWTSAPIEERPDLRSARCEHHYVLALRREGRPLLVIAVLHESMDVLTRLTDRLDPWGSGDHDVVEERPTRLVRRAELDPLALSSAARRQALQRRP